MGRPAPTPEQGCFPCSKAVQVDAVRAAPGVLSTTSVDAWTLRGQDRELRFGGQALSLTPMEFALLSALEQARSETVGYARLR